MNYCNLEHDIVSIYPYNGENIHEILCRMNSDVEKIKNAQGVSHEDVKKELDDKITINTNDLKDLKPKVEQNIKNIGVNHNLITGLTPKVDKNIEDISINTKSIKELTRINVKFWGAIGDGKSHPASEKFKSLSDAQQVYNTCDSLNNEIDRLAIEKTIQNSREVYFPEGSYIIDKSISIPNNYHLYGASKTSSFLTVKQDMYKTLDRVLYVDGNNILIEMLNIDANIPGLAQYPTDFVGSAPGVVTKAIVFNRKPYNTIKDIKLFGFSVGIEIGEDGWCTELQGLTLHRCNTGIQGAGELNSVNISTSTIQYSKTAIEIGNCRTVNITGCDIERGNIGIKKSNFGDIVVKGCYFEYNDQGSVVLSWGQTPVDSCLIEGCSFFTSGNVNKDKFIMYHSDPSCRFTIRNNLFRTNNLDTAQGSNFRILHKLDPRTQCKPIFYENYIDDTSHLLKISDNTFDYYDYIDSDMYRINNKMSLIDKNNFTTEMDSDIKKGYRIFRTEFTQGATLTLPSLKDISYPIKLVLHTGKRTYPTTKTQECTLAPNPGAQAIVEGIDKLNPNKVYTIVFNRMVGQGEEILCYE